MDGIVLFGIILAGLALLGALSMTFGADSRPGFVEDHAPMTFLT